ncbi:tRNA (adenosine(37)-N6)-threonylcarbamoyltransferase complex transferase subunit TsaD [Patescibacteria group bacterium]|nr:tRNA (adenosine(37)-N6)-threonylcarbamoyltransferase complex transferase subunit TsaD [Patescibacteria group bacterium]MBU1922138.1 tRNA (adenosine(37)-N6)-threonylcarbamoyltransferase complex transferase subunit TsaD [Patescibacteria group bacterium]
MKILGIETSCDETALALVEIKGNDFMILKNFVYSQIPIHRKYGGIVPEVAARAHVEKIPQLLKRLGRRKGEDIGVIAVVNGPGLITSLRVGVELAKTLCFAWQKPLVAINHIEAHIFSNWLTPAREVKSQKSPPEADAPRAQKVKSILFPALCLVASGGHTELILMKKIGEYKKLGQTLDDAAGEAFDKVAKFLNMGFPGGPAIAECAARGRADAIDFPRPLLDRDNFDFSFSGLKTAVLYELKKNKSKIKNKKYINDVCASFQEAVIDTLVGKTIKAAKKHNVKTILLAGGVSANAWLRKEMALAIKKFVPKVNLVKPELKYCTDNAAMVAAAAHHHAKKRDFTDWEKIDVDAGLSLG